MRPISSQPLHQRSLVTLIIPQHGRADLTLACIESIRNVEPHAWPIVIIDDGSPDDSADWIERRLGVPPFDNVSLLRQSHEGITVAWNRGARAATTDCLLFLNNDVVAKGPFVERLAQPLVTDEALMTGARMRREMSLPKNVLARLPTRDFLEGWCFALRRDTWQTLGGFDESMRLYFSDTALQCRLIEAHPGHPQPLLALPDLPLHHLGHRTAHALPDHRAQWWKDRAAFGVRRPGSAFP